MLKEKLCEKKKLCNNIYISIIIILLIYFIIITLFSNSIDHVQIVLILSGFILIKWKYDYRKCTFGYIECKIRNVKKKEGYINNFCEYLGDLIYCKYNSELCLLMLFIFILNLIRLIKHIYKNYNLINK